MAEVDRKIEELRAAWHKATEKDKPQDALRALVELERIQPSEPQWSQRLGEAYRRTNNRKEAVDAFVRAFDRYLERGFLPRAVAMAKLVSTMDAERGNLLELSLPRDEEGRIVDPTKPVTGPFLPKPPIPPPPAPLGNEPLPIAIRGATAPAKPPPLPLKPAKPAPLTPAPDSAPDEIRFSDSQDSSISIVIEDFSDTSTVDSALVESVDSISMAPETVPSDVDAFATMATFRLFAALSREALIDLAAAAELVEFVPNAMVIVKNELAFALFAIVSGSARVLVPNSPEIRLVEGDIFGESSLLDEGQRQADVRAETQLMCLRIEKGALEQVMARHPEVEDALFDLLARRLVTNLMNTSPLFAAFDPQGRLELAQRFEVRRAAAGTAIAEKDRRSDGLYIILAGNVVQEPPDHDPVRIARGTAFGHASLMGGRSEVTIRAATEAVLLRMPASGFAALAAQYPPALAYLSETADDPLPESRS